MGVEDFGLRDTLVSREIWETTYARALSSEEENLGRPLCREEFATAARVKRLRQSGVPEWMFHDAHRLPR